MLLQCLLLLLPVLQAQGGQHWPESPLFAVITVISPAVNAAFFSSCLSLAVGYVNQHNLTATRSFLHIKDLPDIVQSFLFSTGQGEKPMALWLWHNIDKCKSCSKAESEALALSAACMPGKLLLQGLVY